MDTPERNQIGTTSVSKFEVMLPIDDGGSPFSVCLFFWLFCGFLFSGFGLVCHSRACSLIPTSLTSTPLIGSIQFLLFWMYMLHALDLSCEFLDL